MDIILNKPSVNINLDSDGLFSYLFLKLASYKGHISGYSNSNDLILSEYPIDDLWSDFYVDLFTPKPNATTIDQHIISNSNDISFPETKINPHILIENHIANNPKSYCGKFPFSTSIFMLGLCEREGKISDDVGLFENIDYKNNFFGGYGITLADLLLRADGCLLNRCQYERNVSYWKDKMIEFSNGGINTERVLEYLVRMPREEAQVKHGIISNGYFNYGLSKDGGYNGRIDLEENLRLIVNLFRSISKYLNVLVKECETTLYKYIGVVRDAKSDLTEDLSSFDTYAFTRNNQIKYTTDFKCCDKITFKNFN